MGALLGKIGAVVTSGFGVVKLWDFAKAAMKAKKLVKELRDAYNEFDDILPKVKIVRENARQILKDEKITEAEALDFTREVYDLIKEIDDFIKEAEDVVAVFKK
jgi:hypothetical protein